jgi:hypothetical protein
MQCPRCGGWHLGGVAPEANYIPHHTLDEVTVQNVIRGSLARIAAVAQDRDPYARDTLPGGDGKLWEARVYGTDERGVEVTVAFGRDNTSRQDHFMIADGHITDMTFYDLDGLKGHDHGGPRGYTQDRNNYSGWESFHASQTSE